MRQNKNDIARLKKRMTANFLLNKTNVFSPTTLNKMTVRIIRQRFEEYWSKWVADDLDSFFTEMELLRGKTRRTVLNMASTKLARIIYNERVKMSLVKKPNPLNRTITKKKK